MQRIVYVGLDVHADTIAVATRKKGGTVKSVFTVSLKTPAILFAIDEAACRRRSSPCFLLRSRAMWIRLASLAHKAGVQLCGCLTGNDPTSRR